MIPAFPLQWPNGWKRTALPYRNHGRFRARGGRGNITIAQAGERVLDELSRLGVKRDDIVLSTNLQLRLDGMPRSDQREPGDPGVAVYWQKRDERRVIAIDAYHRVADNLAAVAATLEAMRAIERHGGAAVMDRAFTGFAAITDDRTQPWYVVLGVAVDSMEATVRAAYARLRSQKHPDRGGTAAEFDEVQKAFQRFCAARGVEP